MRILFTTNAAIGHLLPMAPTAQKLIELGHAVRVACPSRFATTVTGLGLRAIACREEPVAVAVVPFPELPDPRARLAWAVMSGWPWDAREWVDTLLEHARIWHPELVVVEPVEYAGRIVAAALGIPWVLHGWGFTLPAAMSADPPSTIADLYTRLAPTRATAPALCTDLGPPSVQADDALPAARYRYRPWSQAEWPRPTCSERRRVLVTLGTYANADAAERTRLIAAAAAGLVDEVLVVLGNSDRGPATDFPPGTVALPWVDMPAAVAACDAIVHHGGAGTSWAALCAGRAAVVLPQAGDQLRNADLLSLAGAALCLQATDLNRSVISHAISRALNEPALAASAARIAAENARLPDLDRLAADLV
ncbi:DUF1205 domain-containing protein, partial [Acidimicrobiaceae bacterium USS-CC1]|nr:DUF1205 domain-containing protein [Acidiferrimicrobium australe]